MNDDAADDRSPAVTSIDWRAATTATDHKTDSFTDVPSDTLIVRRSNTFTVLVANPDGVDASSVLVSIAGAVDSDSDYADDTTESYPTDAVSTSQTVTSTTEIELVVTLAATAPLGRFTLTIGTASAGTADFTAIPAALDAKALRLDADSALRSTIITVGETWAKKAQNGLIASKASIVASSLAKAGQKDARSAAFDLLDALTRSGALAIKRASLHVVIASTHCFTRSLMATLVKDNVNPIDKVERSSLIVASTVQGQSPEALLEPAQHARIVAGLSAEAVFLQIADIGGAAAGVGASSSVEELMAALTVEANKPKTPKTAQ